MIVSPEYGERPAYVPSWYSWWPGEDPGDVLTYTIREAKPGDIDGMRALLHAAGHKVSLKTLGRWLGQNAYSVRLVCRNYRHPVAVCVSKTLYDGTRIVALHVAPQYAGKNLDRKLLLLAAAELPEAETVIRVPPQNAALIERLRALDWKATRLDRDRDEYVFTRRLYRPGAESSPPDAPAAGS